MKSSETIFAIMPISYILKARVLGVQTPQTNLNFPQKDCLRTSGGTLCRDNCQLIGMSLIGLARQVQKNRD